MLKLLLRCAMFMLGLALLVDAGLPVRDEMLKVDGHSSHRERDTSTTGPQMWDTKYTLHLLGGSVDSCSVGLGTYKQVNDGDSVNVRSTKLFRRCVHIARGGEVLLQNKHWRLWGLVLGLLAFASGFGWVKPDDDFSIRLR